MGDRPPPGGRRRGCFRPCKRQEIRRREVRPEVRPGRGSRRCVPYRVGRGYTVRPTLRPIGRTHRDAPHCVPILPPHCLGLGTHLFFRCNPVVEHDVISAWFRFDAWLRGTPPEIVRPERPDHLETIHQAWPTTTNGLQHGVLTDALGIRHDVLADLRIEWVCRCCNRERVSTAAAGGWRAVSVRGQVDGECFGRYPPGASFPRR